MLATVGVALSYSSPFKTDGRAESDRLRSADASSAAGESAPIESHFHGKGDPSISRSHREDEFVDLLTRHKHQIFNLIFCMVQSLADAEDVFQQTTMVLWNKFDEFQPGTEFGAWASRVARFRALNFIRSKRRERVLFSEDLVVQLAETRFDSAEMQDARLRALASCREKLSQADQMLLSVCYGGGTTIREAAKLIGRPVGAVYDSLSRIRGALYDCIERTLAKEGY
ncbi:MAG: sigma-70 family RNA polymerase sigma factor [Pirellulales bacterium]|nr:sigma-70 family RNA polymerase sigma factor [Pirellulales bacterium]